MSMPDVVVIGAGVVGASVAYRLATGGARVTLVDRGRPGAETTSRSFAWLNANDKPPPAYHALNAEGIQAHRRLRDALGSGPWLHETGNVTCAVGEEDAASLRGRVQRLQDVAYPAELISAERAADLESRVRWPGGSGSAVAFAHFPLEGWAHGPTLVRCLVEAVRERGAAVREDDAVVAIERAGERLAGVRLASDERVSADAVVVAAGRFSDEVARLDRVELPLAPTCGLLAITAPVEGGPRGVVHLPGVHFRPDGDGRVVLQDADTDAMVAADTPPDPALPGCTELLRRAHRYLPDLAGTPIVEARVGIRPMPSDGFPVVGAVTGRAGLYLAVTHSGMTLGPLLGELLSAEILGGAPDSRLGPFRPDRRVRLG